MPGFHWPDKLRSYYHCLKQSYSSGLDPMSLRVVQQAREWLWQVQQAVIPFNDDLS